MKRQPTRGELNRKIEIYRQHTHETCGVACILMVLHYFRLEVPTIGQEYRLYNNNRYRTRCMPGMLGSAIALALSDYRLEVSLVHSSEALMENHDYYPAHIYEEALREYKKFIALGSFDVQSGVPITPERLRDELRSGRLVILQCFVDAAPTRGHVSYLHGNYDPLQGGRHSKLLHAVLVYDFDNEGFYTINPDSFGKEPRVYLSDTEIQAAIDTPVGGMYIAAGKPTK